LLFAFKQAFGFVPGSEEREEGWMDERCAETATSPILVRDQAAQEEGTEEVGSWAEILPG